MSLLSSANMDFSKSLCKGVTQLKTYKLAEFDSIELNGRFKAKDWINLEVALQQTQWIQCADTFWLYFSIKQNNQMASIYETHSKYFTIQNG